MKKILCLFLTICGSPWASAEVIRSNYKENLCLAVNDDPAAGWRTDRNVEVATCDGDDHQQFTLVPVQLDTGETVHKFQALGQCLDIDAEATEPWTQGNNVLVAPCADSISQQFDRVDIGEGWFSIRSRIDGRCLDIDLNTGNGWRTETNVHLWQCHEEPNQLWTVPLLNPESPAQNP
ncbi:RICIN domain-containing protein [Oligoflexus tunisiensis]|uniref:RICIN domain-containing protein n=1 Tax=Oligoflexus tunisiensis TaxID=708132 RepID=UPI00159EFD91|nr:RICIN domain-containing protein [Oligoflexus tunisiensis]